MRACYFEQHIYEHWKCKIALWYHTVIPNLESFLLIDIILILFQCFGRYPKLIPKIIFKIKKYFAETFLIIAIITQENIVDWIHKNFNYSMRLSLNWYVIFILKSFFFSLFKSQSVCNYNLITSYNNSTKIIIRIDF